MKGCRVDDFPFTEHSLGLTADGVLRRGSCLFDQQQQLAGSGRELVASEMSTKAAAGRAEEAGSMERQTSSPILNEAQRAALDAALATKQRLPGAAGVAGATDGEGSPRAGRGAYQEHVKTKSELEHDRHRSRMGKGSGKTKKGGAGGKFTWGSPLLDDDRVTASVDRNDPNYSSDDDQHAVAYHSQKSVQIKIYKQAVIALIDEYFNSSSVAEAASSLLDLEQPEFGHFFVKKAVTMAMDRHDREREMVSVLLSSLYSDIISAEQLQKGFINIIDSVEDLKLDVPSAVDIAATFTARAVTDDILPPAFIAKLSEVEGSPEAEVKAACSKLLGARHSAERMLRCWNGAKVTLEELRASMEALLREYVASGDLAEAGRCLRELSVPFYHHQLVKSALHMAMEEEKAKPVLDLLAKLAESGEISATQMIKGFQRVAVQLEDTALDNPQAEAHFEEIVKAATAAGWLDADFKRLKGTPASEPALPAGRNHVHSVQSFKASAVNLIKEYFSSSDAAEVARSLAELDEPGLHHIFVKQAVSLAMDRTDRERELTSLLLVELSPAVIETDQLRLGFTRLLASVEDLSFDVKDAASLLSHFVGRAIVDEILPPSCLTAMLPALRNDSLGVSVVQTSGKLLGARHAAERLQNCWHGGARSIAELRASMEALLREYITNGDIAEAARCLSELSVPLYHHELVKRALVMCFELEAKAPMLLALLESMAASGQVNQTQMRKGFERVKQSLEDLQLDYPHARETFASQEEKAKKAGWLSGVDT
ncbi:hypothetical protein WJX72_001404 [[Myrmecia] bisecta]|uniref:MI domain-containing protein n=1 Tax=[Myrmecia] bisecta TaxID=41462 RepID=A0AAW1R5G8_9CHLO